MTNKQKYISHIVLRRTAVCRIVVNPQVTRIQIRPRNDVVRDNRLRRRVETKLQFRVGETIVGDDVLLGRRAAAANQHVTLLKNVALDVNARRAFRLKLVDFVRVGKAAQTVTVCAQIVVADCQIVDNVFFTVGNNII